MHLLARDITSPRLLLLKGALLAVLGVLATGMLVAGVAAGEPGRPEVGWPGVLALHAVAVWAWCRAYYFAFYVVERYMDPTGRYAGLLDALRRGWRLRRR